jgi:hypothetical protein
MVQQSSSSSSTPASPPLIQCYLDDLAVQNPNTAKVVGYYLEDFVQYVKDMYRQDAASDMVVDRIIKDVKSGEMDVYDLLRGYVHYLDIRKWLLKLTEELN